MFNKMVRYIKRKRKSKMFMLSFTLGLLSVITGLSYSVFMISTEKYRASEMFIANLIYGISITDEDNTSTINGKTVTVPSNTTETITVTLTSLNPIDSNYKLQYLITSGNAEVKYSSRTNWLPKGTIGKTDSTIYVKEIEVVITTTETSTIEIGASGGYIYNDINEVALIDGYTEITEKQEITYTTPGTPITEQIEEDTNCQTTETTNCLYGGETTNNYLQYPETSDKTENIWRIIGTYNIDNQVVAKLISETSTTSTYTEAVTNLNTFYNTLEDPQDYILATNKFLCTDTCTSSTKYSTIGLINTSEYNKVGGQNSYLANPSSYFTLTEPTETTVENITSEGIKEINQTETSGLRAVVYTQDDVMVKGSGTQADPYVFVPRGDVNVIAWTLDGEEQNGTFPTSTSGYTVTSVTCTNNATATWDEENWKVIVGEITEVPVNCTVNFQSCEEGSLCAQILADNPNKNTRTNFNEIFTESNNGNTIYRASGQDNKTTFYFAGAVTNNYVKFGTDASGNELWWRIVRINEDKSVRLIYAGTSATDTTAFISTSQAFNASYNMSYYAGYEYAENEQHGLGTNSDIKGVVDTWYTSNLADEAGYLSQTAIYCNDRAMGTGYTWATNSSSTLPYAAYERLVSKYSGALYSKDVAPTFACSENADRFTVSSTTGNGALENPIALITADEVAYAGAFFVTDNTSYYIAQNASSGAIWWWTMSPSHWSSTYSGAYVLRVGGSTSTGYLDDGFVGNTNGVRPVTSLKSCVTWKSGNGTSGNPYTVSISDTCATAEN